LLTPEDRKSQAAPRQRRSAAASSRYLSPFPRTRSICNFRDDEPGNPQFPTLTAMQLRPAHGKLADRQFADREGTYCQGA
jgi:hypothetical protein